MRPRSRMPSARAAVFEIARSRETTSRGRSGGQRTYTLLDSADFKR